jgi:hypothetical protein
LPNKPIQRPDVGTTPGKLPVEVHLRNFPEKVRDLFELLDKRVKKISEEIWYKVTARPGVTYYSPERVFIYLRFQKRGLRLTIFTGGEKIEGVKIFGYQKGGAKWGRIHLRDGNQLENVAVALKKSYELIKEAIKNNDPTGWYAGLEEETGEDNEEGSTTSDSLPRS